ncbi:helix-turn-helix domain-containing protein [Bacillus sp. 3255]|uniref:helix-turn-helix domain-containing protein n=1 Tax=Bacillus sp. 3255 TaxID=2817904 RepID=UPI0028628701|nr:transcriptional regulator with XRE-family HTH domain [Bacillus sp. 3255]
MFGKHLAELRNNKGISQYELATQMNLSRGQIANYEQGTREPDFATLVALADFFEVSLDDIAFLSGNKESLTQEEADFLKERVFICRVDMSLG